MISEHLPRWLFASAAVCITARTTALQLQDPPLITFYEGGDRDPALKEKESVEFRLDGPRCRQLGSNDWEVWVAINVLFTTTMNDRNTYRKYEIAGKIAAALTDPIPVYKFGDGPDDDRTVLIGCLEVIHDKFNRIQVNHFGQIEKTIRLEQSTVEAHYRMYLTGDTISGTH